MIAATNPKNSLELGCGLGRLTSYMQKQGIQATGVDFSEVAIQNAIKRTVNEQFKPTLLVGDVTNLKILNGQFDVAYDIGCFHCLKEPDQRKYISEVYRLLKPGATLLIWALDDSPSGIKLNPDYIGLLFKDYNFRLVESKFSRRRLAASHWYWLVK